MTEQYAIKWETYLVSSRDVVVLYVDGRGTGGRGKHWMHQIYKRLGTVEVDDTIRATRYVDVSSTASSFRVANSPPGLSCLRFLTARSG